MAVTVHLPGYLSALVGGRSPVILAGQPPTVADALAALWERHPALRDRVLDEAGALRPHVNVFVGRESIRHTGGLATPLASPAVVFILPAVSGGTDASRL